MVVNVDIFFTMIIINLQNFWTPIKKFFVNLINEIQKTSIYGSNFKRILVTLLEDQRCSKTMRIPELIWSYEEKVGIGDSKSVESEKVAHKFSIGFEILVANPHMMRAKLLPIRARELLLIRMRMLRKLFLL